MIGYRRHATMENGISIRRFHCRAEYVPNRTTISSARPEKTQSTTQARLGCFATRLCPTSKSRSPLEGEWRRPQSYSATYEFCSRRTKGITIPHRRSAIRDAQPPPSLAILVTSHVSPANSRIAFGIGYSCTLLYHRFGCGTSVP